MTPSVVDLPLSVSTLLQIIRDAEHLATRYGSTTAACARLDELERRSMEMQTQLASLHQEMKMSTGVKSQSDRHSSGHSPEHGPQSLPPLHHHLNYQHHTLPSGASLDVDALVAFLQHHCMLQGDPDLLAAVLDDFVRIQADPASNTHIPPRAVVITVDEAAPPPRTIKKQSYGYDQHHNKPSMPSRFHWPPPSNSMGYPMAENPPTRTRRPSPRRQSYSNYQPHRSPSPARPLLPHLRPDESAAATLSSMSVTGSSSSRPSSAPVVTNGTSGGRHSTSHSAQSSPSRRSGGRVKVEEEEEEEEEHEKVSKRKRTSMTPQVEIVVKQNLNLPHDKRNIVELKQSSMLLTLTNLEALNKTAPWDHVYQSRAQYSHILNYTAMEERARKWFVGALRVQFVWRREFWERLHWLPMSEAVCSGPQWERYRQQRKRRANKAIAAWRKLYGDSIELIRIGLLPQDVWCDVALWYMPATPLYWLPSSSNLEEELQAIDQKQPVRCYHLCTTDIKTSHPFYQDSILIEKYPTRYELPSIQEIAMSNEEKETRVNVTPE